MTNTINILYLEDDMSQAKEMLSILEAENLTTTHCLQGSDFLKKLEDSAYDLLILDWELPDFSGIEVLEQVRTFYQWKGPVLFVTSRDSEQDIVKALEVGADDYMIKPIRRGELVARLSALSRRAGLAETTGETQEGQFTITPNDNQILVDGENASLTSKEYELGSLLLKNVGRLFSRKYLLKHIWGIESDISTRTVDAHISSLRRKLKIRAASGYRIKTVYQHGYRLEKLLESD